MKSIIIDGCNVAECEFFRSEYLEDDSVFCEFCTMFYNACLNNLDCYFKQLQRAKADIEELKESNDWYDKAVKELLEDKEKLKAEIEQYKKSKQASYESMQREWNKAVNELRNVKAENEKLKAELDSCNNEFGCEEMVKIKAENEKLKNRNKLYKKIIKENIEKANNNFMILTACIQGNLSIDEVKEYAKLNAKNDELKRKLKSYKQALEEVEKYCNECNLKADYTACEVLKIIDEVLN